MVQPLISVIALFATTAAWAYPGTSQTCHKYPDLCQGTKTYVCSGPAKQVLIEITPLSQSDEYIPFRSRTEETTNGRVIRYSRSSTSKHPSKIKNILVTDYLKYDYRDYLFWISSENVLHVKKGLFGQKLWLELGPPYLNRSLPCRLLRQNN
jgi:hypothetical protein